MPAKSKKQRRLMGLAEHHPEEVSGKNKGVLKMNRGQLHDFAATKEKGLPLKKKHHLKTDSTRFVPKKKK